MSLSLSLSLLCALRVRGSESDCSWLQRPDGRLCWGSPERPIQKLKGVPIRRRRGLTSCTCPFHVICLVSLSFCPMLCNNRRVKFLVCQTHFGNKCPWFLISMTVDHCPHFTFLFYISNIWGVPGIRIRNYHFLCIISQKQHTRRLSRSTDKKRRDPVKWTSLFVFVFVVIFKMLLTPQPHSEHFVHLDVPVCPQSFTRGNI